MSHLRHGVAIPKLAARLVTQIAPWSRTKWRAETAKIRLCAVCPAPATYLGYDGLDPNEQRHPDTGRPYSIDAARYQPLCAARR